MKIAVDLMGGDHGIPVNLSGCMMALNSDKEIDIVLVGKAEEIEPELKNYTYDKERIEIVDAREVITNDDEPAMAIRKKKDSSIVVGLNLLKNGSVDAFVSSGSTGALMSGGLLIVKRIKGIERPAMGFIFPKKKGNGFLLDAGANADCKPKYLQQFAIMGSIYSEEIMGREKAKVGLINIGSESEKGNELTKKAYELLRETPNIEFQGNVESRDLFTTEADVLVCDGFTGNIILKTLEGCAEYLLSSVKDILMSSLKGKIGGLLIKKDIKKFSKSVSYNEYGGAALLGISRPVVKAHGSSDDISIRSTILQAKRFVENDVISKIEAGIEIGGSDE